MAEATVATELRAGGAYSEVSSGRRVLSVTTYFSSVGMWRDLVATTAPRGMWATTTTPNWRSSGGPEEAESSIVELYVKHSAKQSLFHGVMDMQQAHAIAIEQAKKTLGCDSLSDILIYG